VIRRLRQLEAITDHSGIAVVARDGHHAMSSVDFATDQIRHGYRLAVDRDTHQGIQAIGIGQREAACSKLGIGT